MGLSESRRGADGERKSLDYDAHPATLMFQHICFVFQNLERESVRDMIAALMWTPLTLCQLLPGDSRLHLPAPGSVPDRCPPCLRRLGERVAS